ncbi:MAG: ABC transporter ATP-binding protein [Firmicutes bacterium]|nr:ABC transporter ATP-binding protein [Bacillota bacterium]
MPNKTLRVERVTKRYGALTAVNQLTLTIRAGEVFALLGPNGAGKTTTLEMIEGLRQPDEGRVWWGDVDLAQKPAYARQRFGVQLQNSEFFELLTVRETLELFHSLYRQRLAVPDLIVRLDLAEKQHARVGSLSGGQRQRLALACALVNDPEIVFLDEPSAGLDPQARQNLWAVIRQLQAEGRTVVLTTHYMEEAAALADRVAIVDHGTILDEGTVDELIHRHTPSAVLELSREVGRDVASALSSVQRVDIQADALLLVTDQLEKTLIELVNWANDHQRPLTGLKTRQATLEDVFLTLTGRSLRE